MTTEKIGWFGYLRGTVACLHTERQKRSGMVTLPVAGQIEAEWCLDCGHIFPIDRSHVAEALKYKIPVSVDDDERRGSGEG